MRAPLRKGKTHIVVLTRDNTPPDTVSAEPVARPSKQERRTTEVAEQE